MSVEEIAKLLSDLSSMPEEDKVAKPGELK
jgi:hypothetical protein